ncbi:MAG: hypothetical protein S4CHLAM6_13620 [Chlamydiae bacterium]|nr:hypothetical protein [Chlamydiota bacterium]
MNVFSSLSWFSFSKEYDENFKAKIAHDIHDFYSDAPCNATLSHYYNKFKYLNENKNDCDQAIHNTITKEINFYSNIAQDPEIKEMCKRHIEVLEVLQSIADKELTTFFNPRLLTNMGLIVLSWGIVGCFGAVMGVAGIHAIFSLKELNSRTITMSLAGSSLAAMSFQLFKLQMEKCLDYPQNQKKQADWALKQKDVVHITKNSRTYYKQFASPEEYLLIKPYNVSMPVTECGILFKQACEQAKNLAQKYLLCTWHFCHN